MHINLWYCTLEENQRGINLADQINEINYGILNEDFPTRITPTVSSSPDITIWFYAPKPHGEQQNSIQRSSHSLHISSFIHQYFFITGVFTASFSTPVNNHNGWCRTKSRTPNLVELSMWQQDNQQHTIR